MKDQSGSATIQTLAVLVFIAVVGTGTFLALSDVYIRLARPDPKAELSPRLAQALAAVNAAMEADPADAADSAFDAWLHADYGEGIRFAASDASSFVNPNWIRKQALEDTALRSLLAEGATAPGLQQFREDEGLAQEIAVHYAAFFTEDAFKKYLSPFSYANVNSADEFALRRLYLAATGDGAGAAVFHAKIQAMLVERRLCSESGLPYLFGAGAAAMSAVATTAPQWNVNFLDPALLEAALSYPAYGLPSPAATAAAIIAERSRREIIPARLHEICGLPADHPLFAYLGCSTYFWRIRLEDADGRVEAVFARRIPESPIARRYRPVSLAES
jgi:hypothetical protein